MINGYESNCKMAWSDRLTSMTNVKNVIVKSICVILWNWNNLFKNRTQATDIHCVIFFASGNDKMLVTYKSIKLISETESYTLLIYTRRWLSDIYKKWKAIVAKYNHFFHLLLNIPKIMQIWNLFQFSIL